MTATARQVTLQRSLKGSKRVRTLSDEIDQRVTGVRTVVTFSATPALDGTDPRAIFDLTLTGNFAPTLTNAVDGAQYTIWLQQDGTGSRIVTWPAGWKWQSATPVVLTTTAGAIDLVMLNVRGTTVYARGFKGFA